MARVIGKYFQYCVALLAPFWNRFKGTRAFLEIEGEEKTFAERSREHFFFLFFPVRVESSGARKEKDRGGSTKVG